MVTQIKIPLRNSKVSLSAIVRLIDGANYSWRLLFLEAAGNLEGPKNILELEKEIDSASLGLSLTWDELVKLADQLSYSVELFIGGGEYEVRSFSKEEILDQPNNFFEVWIELVDSTYWTIMSRDQELIVLIEKKLRQSNIEYISAKH